MGDKKALLMMWKATETSNYDAIGKLIDKGVGVDKPLTDIKMTGLHLACSKGDMEAAEIFLSKGADIEKRDKVGRTPLHFAAANGSNPDLIEMLVSRGADVNAQSDGGDTPLMKAITFVKPEAVQTLIDKGADPEIHNKNGRDSIDLAKSSRDTKILRALNLD